MWEDDAAGSMRLREGFSLRLGRISKKDDEIRRFESTESHRVVRIDQVSDCRIGNSCVRYPTKRASVRLSELPEIVRLTVAYSCFKVRGYRYRTTLSGHCAASM